MAYAAHGVGRFGISQRHSCELASVSRSSLRYQRREARDDALRARPKALESTNARFGYVSLHGVLKKRGLVINKERTYRLYCEEGLQVRTKKRNKLQRPRLPMDAPTAANQRWSMGFVVDQLSNGRRFWILNFVHDFSRELVGQLIGFSLYWHRVVRYLGQLAASRSLRIMIAMDNGSEFISKAKDFWARDTGVKLGFIQPGKPTQNAFVESFNGKFMNECLNQHCLDPLRKPRTQWMSGETVTTRFDPTAHWAICHLWNFPNVQPKITKGSTS